MTTGVYARRKGEWHLIPLAAVAAGLTKLQPTQVAAHYPTPVGFGEILDSGHGATIEDMERSFGGVNGELSGVTFVPPERTCLGELARERGIDSDVCDSESTCARCRRAAESWDIGFMPVDQDWKHWELRQESEAEAAERDFWAPGSRAWTRVTEQVLARDKRIEDYDILDDGPGRWEHLADAYMAEQSAIEHLVAMPWDDESRDYGEQSAAAMARYRRCQRLVHTARKVGERMLSYRRKGNETAAWKCRGLLTKLRRGVSQRYAKSVDLVVKRGQRSGAESRHWEWWLLYLSKAQCERVYREVDKYR